MPRSAAVEQEDRSLIVQLRGGHFSAAEVAPLVLSASFVTSFVPGDRRMHAVCNTKRPQFFFIESPRVSADTEDTKHVGRLSANNSDIALTTRSATYSLVEFCFFFL